ncbi:hypothetical protein AOV_03540 [Anaplasma ovis str. Haibei]|uniref:Uncharacterized protein n=1 Tax=Anaplasma ovis str. Haibei TaxID=1248439 RepID=A0A2Z2LGN3_9RICK|nr:hypothetical protein [Anaplasma ovis]ASI47873.1 hypothetical protein AOV_03540 [Anaplasma ovis str. Haibei]
MSSSAKTGKALAHRIAVANRAHATGALGAGEIVRLLTGGALLFAGAVVAVGLAIASGAVAAVVANPVGIAAAVCVAGAISAVAAYIAVTGVSIRDLYRSWQQVIQVKEEGLVTVQSLQPVLTPITPIAGKINYGKIAKAGVASAAEGTAGAAAKIAKAGVKVAKDSAKVGAKIAKGGVVTGAVGGLVLGAAAVSVVADAVVVAVAVGAAVAGGVVVWPVVAAALLFAGGGALGALVTADAAKTVEDAGNVVEAQLGAQAAAVKALTGVGGGGYRCYW